MMVEAINKALFVTLFVLPLLTYLEARDTRR